MGKYEALAQEYQDEGFGDGHISYIHDEFLAGVWDFAEWLDSRNTMLKVKNNA